MLWCDQLVSGVCWICRSDGKLTSEHKIKASNLRSQFGKSTTLIKIQGGEPVERGVYLQGVRSKKIQFPPSICNHCNSSKTQPADKAYDEFLMRCEEIVLQGNLPEDIFLSAPYDDKSSASYVNLFRYFAKYLGCHINLAGLPVPERIRLFVNCDTEYIPVWLDVKLNEKIFKRFTPREIIKGGGNHAEHGGFIIPCHENTLKPQRFLSYLAIGLVYLEFWSDISPIYLLLNYKQGTLLWSKTRASLREDGYI